MIRRALTTLLPYLGAYVGGVLPALALYVSLGRDPLWSLALAAVPVAALAGYHLVHLGLSRAIRRRRVRKLDAHTATDQENREAVAESSRRRGLAPGDRVGEPVRTADARRDAETEPTAEGWTGEVQNPTARERPRRRPGASAPPGPGLHRPTNEPHRTTSADPRRRTR